MSRPPIPTEHDRVYLEEHYRVIGEDFDDRMLRFGEIVEDAPGRNESLPTRDLAAIRTANAVMLHQQALIRSLYDDIAHGTDEHREWLRKAIDNHFGRFK